MHRIFRVLWIAFGGLLTLALVWLAVMSLFRERADINIVGDLARETAIEIFAQDSGVTFTPIPTRARTEIILVTRWDKLPFVPGASALCGSYCAPSSDAVVVRFNRVDAFGWRRLVFVNIEPFLSKEESPVFSLSPEGQNCLVQGLLSEHYGRSGAEWPNNCLADSAVVSPQWPILF